uniref:SUEL-type lectin domain-containing protein n=1 Tax=Ciona savignyi TaxID=51511 RepID=H2ZLI8_CIOSA
MKIVFVLACFVCVATAYEISSADFCENSRGNLGCLPGQVMVIRDAIYGRESAEPCEGGKNSHTICSANGVKEYVTNKCQGKQRCYLESNNGLFGDPCKDVSKYLHVEFWCQAV